MNLGTLSGLIRAAFVIVAHLRGKREDARKSREAE